MAQSSVRRRPIACRDIENAKTVPRVEDFTFDEGGEMGVAGCGIFADVAEDALAAFGADSQGGTKLGRVADPKRLNAASIEALLAAIAQHPGFDDPDIILN